MTAGALLADAGRKVLVLEGAPTIGGSTSSATYKGQPMEYTPHYPSGTGHIEDVFSKVGKPVPPMLSCEFQREFYRDGKMFPLLGQRDDEALKLCSPMLARCNSGLGIYS